MEPCDGRGRIVAAVMERVVVRGGTGFATALAGESLVRVTDVAGRQVGDLVLFCTADPSERFSQANTRKL